MNFMRTATGHADTPARRGVRALTLLEVIIALAIIAVLLTAMLSFFWNFVEARKQASYYADRTQIARQVLDRMAAELRSCVGLDEIGFPLERGQRLTGDRRSIGFLTLALPERHQYETLGPEDVPPPAQHDLRYVGYSLWLDTENLDDNGDPMCGGIVRTEKRTLNQFLVDEEDPEQVRNDLWSHELAYLEFRYFDGVEWDTKWDITEGNALPQLIQVTVGFNKLTMDELEDRDLDEYALSEYPLGDDQTHPDRYSTIVRLTGADRFFSSRIQRVGKQFSDQLGVGGVQP